MYGHQLNPQKLMVVGGTVKMESILLMGLKNLLGFTLVLAGVAMIFLPGQGVLTIVVGLGLMNFPGKYKLERRLIRIPAVHLSINWMRKQGHKKPLLVPEA